MAGETILELDHVGLCYRKPGVLPWRSGKFWALEDVSFALRRGETLGVIGYNGAGKSSLLKIIAGIINPDAGEVRRNGVSVALLSFGAGFEPRLTGRQNIVLNALQLGMSRAYVRVRMDRIIGLADLGSFIDQPVRTYSTGMRARLGFATAIFIETDILLIDEVLAVGDEAFRRSATELIKERIGSDLTVVIVSHAMQTIRELCARVIQIEHGRSLEELPCEETIKRYLERRVTPRDDG